MPDRLTTVVIVGARGRMGRTLIRTIMDSDDMALAAAVDRTGGPGLGQDAGVLIGMPPAGITVTDELAPPRGSVVVDFSLPGATDATIAGCAARRCPLVLGTTGISSQTRSNLKQAATQIPIVSAANFSAGITVLTRLAALAARALGPDWDAELFELHHRHKRDAPSGTALRIGKAVAQATDRVFDKVVVKSRDQVEDARAQAEIGIAALRGGDSVGEHTLMLLGDGERLEFVHRAGDRGIFARGALRAARWVVDREPGLYDMGDVLDLAGL
jgi:4-hydroxy-tetrahydrodipicolinate reductase